MSLVVAHGLNALAYAALRVRSPVEANRAVRVVARAARIRLHADEARRILGRLRGGTCLSRALAVAALLPGAEVVIGVRPGERGDVSRGVHAHAWVEVDARPLRDADVIGQEIARLKARLALGNVLA